MKLVRTWGNAFREASLPMMVELRNMLTGTWILNPNLRTAWRLVIVMMIGLAIFEALQWGVRQVDPSIQPLN